MQVKRELPYLVYIEFRKKKKSTTNYDKTSLGEIICEIHQNGKTDGKLKTVNPNYDEKSFPEKPFDIYRQNSND